MCEETNIPTVEEKIQIPILMRQMFSIPPKDEAPLPIPTPEEYIAKIEKRINEMLKNPEFQVHYGVEYEIKRDNTRDPNHVDYEERMKKLLQPLIEKYDKAGYIAEFVKEFKGLKDPEYYVFHVRPKD